MNLINRFKLYDEAVKANDESRWTYTQDTVKVWFDDKIGNPVLRIKGEKAAGLWKAWDEEMHARSGYDSLWYDLENHTIMGHFYENNDFYELIGKGPTHTLQTFWLTKEDKISEILIFWIPEENTTTGIYLKPIVDWARKYDSQEINEIYSNGKILPSKENAVRWKKLIQQYKNAMN